MNRITTRFAKLRESSTKGLVVYIGAGDPHLDATRELALAFDRAGVDVLELGVPFSDPLADGLANQLAAQRGLDSGATPDRVLETVARIRRESQLPIALYIYYNLVHRQGLENFIRKAARAGVDGLLVLDLPPEEAQAYEAAMAQADLCNIYLIAPTTPEERIAFIASRARGFIYYVTREGVTGMQSQVASSIPERVGSIRRHTSLPIAVGFGISNASQAVEASRNADAVVVGSAVVTRIGELGASPDMVPRVSEFVHGIAHALKNPR